MFPIFVPGVGWIFQPAFPAASGCVYTPVKPKSFGLRSTVFGAASFVALLWLWLAGHPVEVMGAVVAAVAVEALVRISERLTQGFHGRRILIGGRTTWL
ncbi:hypothetical protein [Streptomyces salinarius]|uniref:Uncharacterized protein n=1 Tax=Streptomyces salinarius TaxID=2762598 RepID=A0ABW8BLU3_9ACTN